MRLGLAAVFARALNDYLSRSTLATPRSPAWQRQPQGRGEPECLLLPSLYFKLNACFSWGF